MPTSTWAWHPRARLFGETIDVHVERGEPVGEGSVFGFDGAGGFVEDFGSCEIDGDSCEFGLEGWAFPLAGEDEEFVVGFADCEFDALGGAFDGEVGVGG